MSTSGRPVVGYAAMITIAVCLAGAHNVTIRHEYQVAREHFQRVAVADATREGRRIDAAFRSIYENIRTISRLPSVIDLNRQGSNLGADDRETLRQVYDNLAHAVSVSEVYVVPVDFDPSQTDRATRTAERPSLTFGDLTAPAGRYSTARTTLRSGAASTEPVKTDIKAIKTFEFRQLKEHQSWLQENYPTADKIDGLNVPMIAGSEVITSDNTHFVNTGNDADRSGLMFSVPLYDRDGVLKGSVTAVILSRAIRALLPSSGYTLLNEKYRYASTLSDNKSAGPAGPAGKAPHRAEPFASNPDLVVSTVVGVAANDPRSKWLLWVGLPKSAFYASPAVNTIRLFEMGGYVGIFLLMNLFFCMLWLENTRAKAKRAAYVAQKTKAAHAKTVEAERETRRLNEELEVNMKMLSETQKELVKHERLAALGQVTATLSHEIRNPLGAIRSSLYILRQAVDTTENKLERALDRIERSVCRCDNLIDDFLEYTRTNKLSIETIDASKFLEALLDEQSLPGKAKLTRDFPLPGPRISVDPDRFRRVIINLLENAVQAINESNPDGGEINISCHPHEDGSVISVQDNGPGIPDDVFGKIFEPLFTTKSFGAGLGLPTVKQLVEQHNAVLTIDTEIGVGTTFKVVLPPASETTEFKSASKPMEKAA